MIESYFGDCGLYRLNVRGDERGSLIALEGLVDLPFEIERVYYIFGTAAGVVRGRHAHRDLQQLAICLNGSCTFDLDDGTRKVSVQLDRPDEALRIGSMVWREMREFSDDCVLLVLASRRYDESDYIRDYEEFLRNARCE